VSPNEVNAHHYNIKQVSPRVFGLEGDPLGITTQLRACKLAERLHTAWLTPLLASWKLCGGVHAVNWICYGAVAGVIIAFPGPFKCGTSELPTHASKKGIATVRVCVKHRLPTVPKRQCSVGSLACNVSTPQPCECALRTSSCWQSTELHVGEEAAVWDCVGIRRIPNKHSVSSSSP
jgi:hypothetical protein